MARVYDLQEWKHTRREYLTEHPLCKHCKARAILKPAVHVDHILDIKKGGAWFDWSNLQGLCPECHSIKTARDEGKTVHMGCDVDGNPIDTQSHWN
jgi:5-methylcytosine-specific restriction protein A